MNSTLFEKKYPIIKEPVHQQNLIQKMLTPKRLVKKLILEVHFEQVYLTNIIDKMYLDK